MITSKHIENLFSLFFKCSKFPCLPCHLSLVMVFDRDGGVLRFSTGQRSSILAALRSCWTWLGYQMPNTLALEELHDIWNNDFKEKDLALVESIKHSSIHPSQFVFAAFSLWFSFWISWDIYLWIVAFSSCQISFSFPLSCRGTWQRVQPHCCWLHPSPPIGATLKSKWPGRELPIFMSLTVFSTEFSE